MPNTVSKISARTAATVDVGFGRLAARVHALQRQSADVATEIRAVLKAAQAMLADIEPTSGKATSRSGRTRTTRRLSKESRARIAAAQRKRWARYRAEKNRTS